MATIEEYAILSTRAYPRTANNTTNLPPGWTELEKPTNDADSGVLSSENLRCRRYSKFFYGLFLVLLIPLSACSRVKTVQWSEEVKLTNGGVIVVERSVDCTNVYAGGGGNGCLFQFARIKGKLGPQNREVSWEGRLGPLSLDVANNGDVYLVAIVETAQGESEYAVKDGNHAAFKYKEPNQWLRIPISAIPPEIQPNLFVSPIQLFVQEGQSTNKIVDLAQKKIEAARRVDDSYRHWPKN
jgi:hypothetical protein